MSLDHLAWTIALVAGFLMLSHAAGGGQSSNHEANRAAVSDTTLTRPKDMPTFASSLVIPTNHDALYLYLKARSDGPIQPAPPE